MSEKIKMIDITEKKIQKRIAKAKGKIKLQPTTIKRIREGKIEKGNIIATAKIAAIMAAKKTPETIPLCHPIQITNINVEIDIKEEEIEVTVTVTAKAKTGVEIEALTATATALITIWDMVKKYEKDERGMYQNTYIESIKVELKIKE